MANFDLVGSLTPGFKLGSSLRRGFDERKQAALGAQQREVLGGLRRRSLGLGGATSEQAQEARLELLSADPVAADKFFTAYSKIPTTEQDKFKIQMGRIATAADNIASLPDNKLSMGMNQTRQAFINSGDQQAAQRVDALMKENLEPDQLRIRLGAISAQTRDQEKLIASRERADAIGKGGMASAKTVTFNNGSVLMALPDRTSQVLNPAGEVVTGQDRLDVLNNAQKSGITQAGLKEFTRAESKAIGEATGAEKVLEITTNIAEKTAAAKQKGVAKIKLATDAEIAKSVSIARKEGATEADDVETLASLDANMAGLQEIVGNLKELGKVSTFTMKGRAFDALTREFGFNVSEGANARAKFIAIVDNEILPLLKQTFGAAFTAKEGETLKKTLGDPNASPSEKNQQLDAFISGKLRQAENARRKLGVKQLPAENVIVTDLSDEDLFR